MGVHNETCGPEARLSWWELWPMLGWGLFTVHLYLSGSMKFFLRPIYAHLAGGAGFVLLAAFVCGWWHRRRSMRARRDAHDEDHRHTHDHDGGACGAGTGPWRIVRSLAFLVPLVVGLALPERGLNALAALQRGAADPAMLAELAAQQETVAAERRGEYQFTTVLGVLQRARSSVPVKVGALGFVARPKEMRPGTFLLVRFNITCCAADAAPVAIPVHATDPKVREQIRGLKENQWVELYGVAGGGEAGLRAEEIVPTSEPDKPYL